MTNEILSLYGETLRDEKGNLVGWIADDGKFHPCGASLTAEQLRAILALIEKE